MREGPLAEINNKEELEAWLPKQPREVSVAFAARAALRVLPIVQLEKRKTYIRDLALPVFRSTVVSWAAANYPANEKELATACRAAAARAAQSTVPAWGSSYARAAARAADYAAVVTIRDTASADATNAATEAIDAIAAFGTGLSLESLVFATALGANPVGDAFWSAVSIDATQVEEGAAASVIAGSPLWPQGQPDAIQSLWQETKATLLAATEDWQVWTNWYDRRLAGRIKDEERELAYVRIEEALWDQGPAKVNAEIKRLLEAHEPQQSRVVQLQAHSSSGVRGSTGVVSTGEVEQAITAVPVDNPPIAGAAGQPRSEILAAWQSPDAALQMPHPRRQYVPDVLFNPVALGAGGTPPAAIEAIPEQEPLATRFGVNSQGLIDLILDPPAPGTAADPLQREFYEEVRLKTQSLVAVGPNQLGDLSGPANRFCDCLKDRIEDISITSLWSRGNTLRIRLKVHDLSMSNGEPDPGRLHPLVAETLRDVVHTWNIFIVGDPKGRELDEIRLGPQEVEAAKRVVVAAAPVVKALQQSENVATPAAIEAIAEQAETAKTAPAGIDGDQAIGSSRKTTGNFVSELLRTAYSLCRGEGAVAWKEFRAGIYRAAGTATFNAVAVSASLAIISFVVRYADALKGFVTASWHNPSLVEMIDFIVRVWP